MKQFILFFLVLLPVCAFAQFTETFDGPEVNSANPWKGDLDKFVISNGQLVFDGSGLADTCSLYLPINYAPTMEWEMDVSFAFKPSNVNKACIYLYRTGKPSDLIFYIQVGSNKDNVSLYIYPPKGKPKALITGERQLEGRVAHIKLVLEDHKYWTLYTRLGNEKGYQKEGTSIAQEIQDILDAGSLNISCICKSTSDKYKDRFYYIDNIIVRHELSETPQTPDEEPDDPDIPSVDMAFPDVEVVSFSELQFTFESPVDITNANSFITGIGQADYLKHGDTEAIVNAGFPNDMVPGKSYTISFTGLMDLSGNPLNLTSEEFELKDDDSNPEISPGSVLINEIMADTAKLKDFPHTEYVELYNATNEVQSLKKYSFVYDNRTTVVLPDVVIPAKGYAVLYRAGRDISIDEGGVGIPLDKFPAQLANAGKLLQLKSPSDIIIDEYSYPKAKPGKSWERSSDGWHLSSDPRGGTPGSANSSGQGEPEQPEKPVEPDKPAEPEIPDDPSVSPTIKVEPKEFIFNELLPNPFAGGSEYFELYNRSDHSLPLSGLSVAVRKTDGTLSTRYPLSSINTLIESDGYAVLTKSIEGVADFYMVTSPAALFEMSKLPILANTSSTLVLFRTEDGTIIDEVSYSSKWHASSIKDQKGVALERIDPEAETQSPSNWTSASGTAGYGTPGYRNSQSDISFPNEPDKPTGIEAPEWVPGSKHYKITYYLDQPGYSCRAFVFNTIGQRVAEIANHELLGLSGELTWNGASLAGSHLRTGVYIFYAELYHTSGTVKRYKQVFLVR